MNIDYFKCTQVINNIYKEFLPYEFSENIGLHGGTSGVALFLTYYDYIIHCKKEVSPITIDILEHNIKCIDNGCRQYTICDGISGFGWLCEHLKKLEMLRKEDIEFLDDLDPFLYNMMIIDIQRGNYDYLHGALGVGSYFITRFYRKEVHEYLEKLLTGLEKTGFLCENGAVKWISVIRSETGDKGYNISLSHGMSSIAVFLIRLHKLNFEIDRVDKLLIRTMKYIIEQATFREGRISYFPTFSKESSAGNYDSRLGWCYGDLGIAHVLWQAANILKNENWENAAIKILNYNSNRRDLRRNAINDAGLCHGSSGVAHIFWNLYLNTHIHVFKEAVDFWFNITIQMAKYNDGLAGFKAWRTERFGGPVKTYSLLEGIAGIGLFLLSYLDGSGTAWDECLMLS